MTKVQSIRSQVALEEMVELLNRREALYVYSNSNCLKGIDIIWIITRKYDLRKSYYNKDDIMASIEASNEIDKSLKKRVKRTVKEWLGFTETAVPKKVCIIL